MTVRPETRLVAWARTQHLTAAQTEDLVRRSRRAAKARTRYQKQKERPAPLGYVECRCGTVHWAYTQPFTTPCCQWTTVRLVDGETLRASGITLPRAIAPGRLLEGHRRPQKKKRVTRHPWSRSLNTSQRRKQKTG
jgi:hypothetical protein